MRRICARAMAAGVTHDPIGALRFESVANIRGEHNESHTRQTHDRRPGCGRCDRHGELRPGHNRPLEDNVTIYHTINGRRTEKKRANMKVPSNQWHSFRVDFQGSHFTVTFNGQKALDWDDETFKDAGKVGVWTKADSVTEFDDFMYASK